MNKIRAERMREMFTQRGADFHAIVCRLPQHVLMLTGYQPILGNSFCIITLNPAKEVEIRLAVPKDEEELVPPGVAVEMKTFSEETMDYIGNTIQAVREPLAELLRSAAINENAVVGIEGAYSPIATSYTQVGTPGPATLDLLHQLFMGGELRDVTPMLEELAAIKTDEELDAIKRSEQVIKDGAEARAVDGAARTVMTKHGFGPAFKHGLGHGFGFQAINHAASPVLHPASHAILRSGMVHNMEPAVYLDEKGGIRLNDNVVVRDDGNEVLSSNIPRNLEWLVVNE